MPKLAIDIILCEDVRVEQSGKVMLIGTYDSAILVKDFPVILPNLAVFARLIGKQSGSASLPKEFSIEIKPPGTESIKVSAEFSVNPYKGRYIVPIIAKGSQLTLEEPGEIRIKAFIDGKLARELVVPITTKAEFDSETGKTVSEI